MRYIQNNRNKHDLIHSEELTDIIQGFVISQEEAYSVNL